MRSISVMLILVVAAMANTASLDPLSPGEQYNLEKPDELFEKYVKYYHKQYKDENTKQVHFQAFVKTLKKINKANKESPSDLYGMNEFTDYTEEEMNQKFGIQMATTASSAPSDSLPKKPYDIEKADELFEQYIKDYHKQYKNENDKQVHFQAFVENLKKINATPFFVINEFTDQTREERTKLLYENWRTPK